MVKIATSILDCKSRVEGVLELNKTETSYIHVDVMDGKFVSCVQFSDMKEIHGIDLVTKYPMDVHLMVENPFEYIRWLGNMNIEFVTVHLEIDRDKRELFKNIRDLGYKVGLSIKPNTKVKDIEPYLDEVDLVLLMSVEPGQGGQKFIENTVNRVKELKELIVKSGRDILIEVDGGINKETISKISDVDIVVVGSYIIKSDSYIERVEELLKACNLEDKKEVIEGENTSEYLDGNIKKRVLYWILLWLGVMPFICLLVIGIISSIFGTTFMFSDIYGLEAFGMAIIVYCIAYWPILVVGLILSIVGISGLRKHKVVN